MYNCIQPPYSPNHFYAFDQYNLRKLQGNNYIHSKRKYLEIDDNEPEYPDTRYDLNQTTPSSKRTSPPLQTADHLSINKYHDQIESPIVVDENPSSSSRPSETILLRLEKILNLCGELRTLASDIESHLHEKQEKDQSEPTLIDIYKELETQQLIDEIEEKNAPPPYQITDEMSSLHSESNKSHPLMVCVTNLR